MYSCPKKLFLSQQTMQIQMKCYILEQIICVFHCLPKYLFIGTVNTKHFVRILFLRIALKDIFPTLKIWDLGMICLYQ